MHEGVSKRIDWTRAEVGIKQVRSTGMADVGADCAMQYGPRGLVKIFPALNGTTGVQFYVLTQPGTETDVRPTLIVEQKQLTWSPTYTGL